jgi:hypothetical protein
MALKKIIEVNSGITVNDAYVRIDGLRGNKDKIMLTVSVYKDKQAQTDGKNPADQKLYNFIPDITDTSLNFVKQGYLYLKTLPEYSDALDC